MTNCDMKSAVFTEGNFKDELEEVSSKKYFGGDLKVYRHMSWTTNCVMKFAAFFPPQAQQRDLPLLIVLPGLKCSEQYFFGISGIQKYATEHGLIIVSPDTSPRGCRMQENNHIRQCGEGAGFYIDAENLGWENYKMFSYLNKELVHLIDVNFPVQPGQRSILGHSMGGHGALISYLSTGLYLCASAFAPACNPLLSNPDNIFPTAYTEYLGIDKKKWAPYDACELMKTCERQMPNILIDQGTEDTYLVSGELLPQNFIDVCQRQGIPVKFIINNNQPLQPSLPVIFRIHEGYDHFDGLVSTFMEDHIRYHISHLKA